ncbi:Uncharacterised protein [Candidatus Anstonella stagnisolia]|nr:Uncharacterised protein [Candidatus Anstonella stagnisolia]
MDVETAADVQEIMDDIVRTLGLGHINEFRIICMRSRNAKAHAYARIWNLPDIWQKALEVKAFYVIEVLSEKFDVLGETEKKKVIIHELLHIPKTFSGALLGHAYGNKRIDGRTVESIYKEYIRRKQSE